MPDLAGRDPIDVVALHDELAHSTWRHVEVVAATGSTNADLLSRAAAGQQVAGTALVAEHQVAGRGRHGRSWQSVPGAQLTVSVGVSTEGLATALWGWVPLAAGVAVVEATAAVTGIRAGLKWPNDVVAGPRSDKLAGILAEVAVPAATIVVGFGVNVSLRPDELPVPTATSLTVLGAASPDRTLLLVALLRSLDGVLGELRGAPESGPAGLAERYRRYSLTIGTRVEVSLPGQRQLVGEASAVDRIGRLRVDTGTDVVAVTAGDVHHLRAR